MKKQSILIVFSLVLFSLVSISQPTLTSSGINPIIGDSFTIISGNFVSSGSSGTNQTWNFSSFSPDTTFTSVYANPASTPYSSTFSGSNIALVTEGHAEISYYKTSSSAWQIYGVGDGTNFIIYTDPDDLLRFPFTYNDTYTNSWSAEFESGGFVFYRAGITSVTADGYGTFITPEGSIQNVLRVHFVQEYKDSADLHGTPYIITYSNDQYLWYKEGIRYPVASVFSFNSSMGGAYSYARYLSGVANIYNNKISELCNIYPNPASDKIFIEFPYLENKNHKIRLINTLGQHMPVSYIEEVIHDTYKAEINTVELPDGIYFVQIINNEQIFFSKQIVKISQIK